MGILSKIFKPFKKIVKKVGKAIKGVAKIIAKPLQAVLKPIGKVFGKLGPIGSIALGFLLPGIGNIVGSWLNGMGGAFQGLFKGMPKIFNAISHVGEAIKSAATWGSDMYGKTIGKVFDSVTGAIRGGIDTLTGGKATDFGNWCSTFTQNIGDKLTYKGPGIQGPIDITDAAVNATKSLTIEPITTTAAGVPFEEAYRGRPEGMSDIDFTEYRKTDAWKEHIKAGQEANLATQKGFLEETVDWVKGGIDKVRGSTAGRAYDAYNTVSSYFEDDPRLRMPGTQGASAFSMLGNMGGDFGSPFSFSQFETAAINNAPTFMETLQQYVTGAYAGTQIPKHDPLGFVQGLGGYAYTSENALGGGGN